MMSVFNYEKQDTFIHRLTGASKLICFLLLTFAIMLSYDIRFILFVSLIALIVLSNSKVRWNTIKWMFFYAITYLLLFSVLLTYLFSPLEGVKIYGTYHEIFAFNSFYVVTLEQLLYQVTKFMKYFAIIPVGMVFFLTTNPSDLAASIAKIKCNYKVAYAFSLTLRYIPEVIRQYQEISLSQQARGIDISKNVKFTTRVKNALGILVPLIFTSLERVESVANAMDLRSFGKNKNRTWYVDRPFTKEDYFALIACTLVFILGLAITIFVNGSRFYNPFI